MNVLGMKCLFDIPVEMQSGGCLYDVASREGVQAVSINLKIIQAEILRVTKLNEINM